MAEQLLQKFRQLYAKAWSVLERWSAAQSRASGLVSSAASIIERLPSLSDDARFGPMVTRFPDLPSATRDAQAEALDRILTSLASELTLFRELVGSLDKLHRDAAQLVAALQPPPKAAGGVRRGPQPSLVECVVGLQDLWRIHRDEAALKVRRPRERGRCRKPAWGGGEGGNAWKLSEGVAGKERVGSPYSSARARADSRLSTPLTVCSFFLPSFFVCTDPRRGRRW